MANNFAGADFMADALVAGAFTAGYRCRFGTRKPR
jgi:hypothetical protein